MAKGKKKSKRKSNNLKEDISGINVLNLLMVIKLLTFNVNKSFEESKFITYSTDDVLENINPINSEIVEKLYSTMFYKPKYYHLYEGRLGLIRCCIAGLVKEMDEIKVKPLEEQFDTNIRINKFLCTILDNIIVMIENHNNYEFKTDLNWFGTNWLLLMVYEAKQEDLTNILNISCDEIFVAHDDDKLMFLR